VEEPQSAIRNAAALLLVGAILDDAAIQVVDVNHNSDQGSRRIGSIIVLNGDRVSRTIVDLIQSIVKLALKAPEEVVH
jgi:hypothetical protein